MSVIFNQFKNGLQPSQYTASGFPVMKGCDVETDENLLKGNTAGVTDSVVASGFVAGCMDVVNNVMYTTTGTHIFKDGVDSHTSPFTIQEMRVHGGKLYFFGDTKIGTYDLASTWNDSFVTILTAGVPHRSFSLEGSLYITNGLYIAAVDSSGAFSANVLDLPNGFVTAHLSNHGTNLLILAYKSTLAKEVQYGLFTWDNLSPTYNSNYFQFGAAAIYGFGKVDDITCAVGYATYKDAENKLLTIYHYDGARLSSFKKVKVEDTYPLSVVNSGEDMLVASKTQVMTVTRNLEGSPISVIGSHNVSLGNRSNVTDTGAKNPATAADTVPTVTPQTLDSYSESNSNQSDSYGLYAGNLTAAGQSFTVPSSSLNRVLENCIFYLRKLGSPTGNAVAKIYAHTGTFGSGGNPTGAALATSDNLDVSTLTTSFALKTFTFSGANRITLSNSTAYFIVIEFSGGDVSNQVWVGRDDSSPAHAGNSSYYSSSTWHASTPDLIFYVKTSQVLAAWANPTNVYSSNDAYATTTLAQTQVSDYLDITNFSFSLPSNATITGVEVDVECKNTVANTNIFGQIIKGGTPTGTLGTISVPTTEAYQTMGGSLSLWGNTYTYSEINASNFGVRLYASSSYAGTSTISVDHVRITVFYSTAAGITDNYGAFLNNTTNTLYLGGSVTQTVNLSGGTQDSAIITTPVAYGKFSMVKVHYKTLNGATIGIETDSDESGVFTSQTVIYDDINKVAYFDGGLTQNKSLQARITLNATNGLTPIISAVEFI